MVVLKEHSKILIEKDTYSIRRFFTDKITGYQETVLTAYTIQLLIDILSWKYHSESDVYIPYDECVNLAEVYGIVANQDEKCTFMELLKIRNEITVSISDALVSIKYRMSNISYADTIRIFYRAYKIMNASDAAINDCYDILRRIFKHREYNDDYLNKIVIAMEHGY